MRDVCIKTMEKSIEWKEIEIELPGKKKDPERIAFYEEQWADFIADPKHQEDFELQVKKAVKWNELRKKQRDAYNSNEYDDLDIKFSSRDYIISFK